MTQKQKISILRKKLVHSFDYVRNKMKIQISHHPYQAAFGDLATALSVECCARILTTRMENLMGMEMEGVMCTPRF